LKSMSQSWGWLLRAEKLFGVRFDLLFCPLERYN
jgi:hypothetical protein